MRKELSEKEIEAFEVIKEFLADIYLSLLENDGYIAIDGSFERYNRIDVYNQYKIVNHLIENSFRLMSFIHISELNKFADNFIFIQFGGLWQPSQTEFLLYHILHIFVNRKNKKIF